MNFRSREEEDYPVHLQMPEKLRDGRDGIAFGNIVKIAEFHRDIFSQVLLRTSSKFNCYFLHKGLGEVLHDPEKLKAFLLKKEPIIKVHAWIAKQISLVIIRF